MEKAWHMENFTGRLSREKWRAMVDFAENLRPADLREIAAYEDGHPLRQVAISQEKSEECWMVYNAANKPIVFFGRVVPEDKYGRLIWCLGTKGIAGYERPFARVSKRILEKWARRYEVLFNAVGTFNEDAVRWLKWCGAIFYDPFAVGEEPFLRFCIKRREERTCAE